MKPEALLKLPLASPSEHQHPREYRSCGPSGFRWTTAATTEGPGRLMMSNGSTCRCLPWRLSLFIVLEGELRRQLNASRRATSEKWISQAYISGRVD
jgi:hypothetical protein